MVVVVGAELFCSDAVAVPSWVSIVIPSVALVVGSSSFLVSVEMVASRSFCS